MLQIFLIALLIVTVSARDPDQDRLVPELIASRKYTPEVHHVQTADGYICDLHRIINPKFAGKQLKPVLLQHGLLSNAGDFLINSPGGDADEGTARVGNNLGFELAKRGYDVWLANSRGNRYCLNHTHYKVSERKFWDFTFDDMAALDLPAYIDYVLAATGSKTLGYVGHSQGTTIMFALLASTPRYNDIVKPFVALAPVTSVGFCTTPIRLLALDKDLFNFLGWKGGPLLPDKLIRFISETFCAAVPPVTQFVCESAIFFGMGGWDSPQLNATRLPVYISGDPAGTSSRNLIHWGQLVNSGRFAKFDWGLLRNLGKYGQVTPPEYELSKITNKNIAILSSDNDGLADPIDVQLLRNKMSVPFLMDYIVPDVLFNHLDFIWARQAGKYVNEVVLSILDQVA